MQVLSELVRNAASLVHETHFCVCYRIPWYEVVPLRNEGEGSC